MEAPSLATHGFAVVHDVIDAAFRARLRTAIAAALGDAAGSRTGLSHPAVRELAVAPAVRALVEPVLGTPAFAVRATLFDKTPLANWLVAWHQDLVVAVRKRREAPGFGPWSVKHGVPHVQAPAAVLAGLLAVRIDLDGSRASNGPMRVLPGTHLAGVLTASQRSESAWSQAAVTCVVPPGGALLMRPLLLHASSRAEVPGHRRVVHLEFAADDLPHGLEWNERVGGDGGAIATP
ncbi:MAG TPA: phytanoyl-CoA dioxygenase family protein [Planctomycetota bacterium]|nr:phytanoyl-CoA dioxygenase family protein [Planctomycetota bacterium]